MESLRCLSTVSAQNDPATTFPVEPAFSLTLSGWGGTVYFNGVYVNLIDKLKDSNDITEISSKHPQHVILEDNRAYPFTINASFRGSCLFRDKVDRADSVEAYFTKGEVFEVRYLTKDEFGDITYGGEKFSVRYTEDTSCSD